MSMDNNPRDRNVTAVLGPTNTGKTHLALERMLAHKSGLIGLPLRLLAREVYDRIVAKIGASHVALVTGEEKIKPDGARYWVSTVEAMPRDLDVEFLAIDEVQLAGDPERGHVFTERMLKARGRLETLLLGAQTMAGAISELVPGANFISRPRLSQLTYAGQKKITRLPRRTAVIAFSAREVYGIAELMRRQRGGAAVVLGGLSPRTRNAQVALYQSGDVDFLVATDAIGMGLNLDVEHVAFSGTRKFDGERHRDLTAGELAQIAGRAGRHMNDGTFGVTGDVEPFEPDLVERLETHRFEPLKKLQWRNTRLDFSSLDALRRSLAELPDDPRLMRARAGDDVLALEAAVRDTEVAQFAASAPGIEKLWDVCQVPDYRKISSQTHADMIATIYKYLMAPDGVLPEDWFAAQVAQSDKADGDIDTLSNRIAHIRTWTFVSNRAQWLKDPRHWQERTRQIEDKLSDALHEQLTQRFVDKRTSALMKGMRDKDELFAEIADDGSVHVEKHFVGKLQGFLFTPQDHSSGIDGKAARTAAAQVLGPELNMRARRVAAAKTEAFKLDRRGVILWRDEAIARIEPGDDPLKPQATILSDEHLRQPDKEKVQARVNKWLSDTIAERLKPLVELDSAEDVSGLSRGIAFRLKENFGCLRRDAVADEIRALDQPSRAQLRRYGVRFGAFNIFFPQLLKPAAADLLLVLWTLKDGAKHEVTFDKMPEPPRPGLTSLPADIALPADYYRVTGFHLCGPRAVRCDILERLADIIRPLLAWKPRSGEAHSAKAHSAEARSAKARSAKARSATTHGANPNIGKPDNDKSDDGKATNDEPSSGILAKSAAKCAPTHAGRSGDPPAGATGDGGFTVTPDMMSILGCSGEELGQVLKALGFRVERRELPAKESTGETAKTISGGATNAESSDAAAGDGGGAAKEARGEAARADNERPAQGERSDTAKAKSDSVGDAPAGTSVDEQAGRDATAPTTGGDKPADGGVAIVATATTSDAASPKADASKQNSDQDADKPLPQPTLKAPTREPDAAEATPVETASTDVKGPAAEPDQATANAQTSGETAPAALPQVIEVWRPARRHYGARSNKGAGRKAPGKKPAGLEGTTKAQRAAAQGSETDPALRAARDDKESPDRQNPNRGKDGRRQPRRDTGGARKAYAGERGSVPKRQERSGRSGGQMHKSAAVKKPKGADPDSPFAALSSLKKQLEKNSEEQSSS